MLQDLEIFERIFSRKIVHGLTLFHGSLRITHCFLPTLIPYFTSPALMVYVEFLMDEVEWHLLDSNLLQGQKLDP